MNERHQLTTLQALEVVPYKIIKCKEFQTETLFDYTYLVHTTYVRTTYV